MSISNNSPRSFVSRFFRKMLGIVDDAPEVTPQSESVVTEPESSGPIEIFPEDSNELSDAISDKLDEVLSNPAHSDSLERHRQRAAKIESLMAWAEELPDARIAHMYLKNLRERHRTQAYYLGIVEKAERIKRATASIPNPPGFPENEKARGT